MTLVDVDLRVPAASGTDGPAAGYLDCAPTLRRHIDAADDYVVLPQQFTATLVGGKIQLTLAPTTATWVWRITERVPGGIVRYVSVPASGTFEYGDLADVDPDTLNPTTPVIPAYQALLDAKAPLASPTFTGNVTVPKLSLGLGVADRAVPSIAIFTLSTADLVDVEIDMVGHVRDTVFNGSWYTSASVVINASGGTAAWSVGGQAANIAATASAATVQTALQALSSVGAGNLTVTGGPGAAGGGTPYIVTYAPKYIAADAFLPLTLNAASLTGGAATAAITWTNNWGDKTGILFGENGYHVTGTAPGDGNGIAVLYGGLFEVDQKSNGTIGKMIGSSAEASWSGANAGGVVESIISMQVNSPLHKDGALPYNGTATSAYALLVKGVQRTRTFTTGATTSGSPTLTWPSGQFVSTDTGKVITGAGIPANTYIAAILGATSVTMSNNATATATGATVTIKGTAQATTAYTAHFGNGDVGINGRTTINGWTNEVQLSVVGSNGQTADLQDWWAVGANKVARLTAGGVFSSSNSHVAAEGLSFQTTLGAAGPASEAGVKFGSAGDAAIYRSGVHVITTGPLDVFKTGQNVTGSRPVAATVGKGAQFFDTTLDKPIWSNGTDWKDATGVTV